MRVRLCLALVGGGVGLPLAAAGCGGGTTVTQTVTQTATQTETPGGQAKKCPDFDFNIRNIMVSGMSCAEAKAALDQLKEVGRSFELGGFHCERAAGSRLQGTWKCTRGSKSFSFAFSD